jgi:integrase
VYSDCPRYSAVWGKDKLQGTASEALDDYKRYLRSRKTNPVTINTILKTLRALFNWGAARGYCTSADIELVKTEKKMPVCLTEKEVDAFLEAIQMLPPLIPRHVENQDEDFWREYWRCCFLLYRYSGGRKQEVASLAWRDIDLDRKIIVFRKTKASREREVPLHPTIAEKLHIFAGGPDKRVFMHSADAIYRQCLRYMEVAGITQRKKMGLHTLRRTFGSFLIMKTGDIATTSRLLGHSSPRVTFDSYVQILEQQARERVEKLSW